LGGGGYQSAGGAVYFSKRNTLAQKFFSHEQFENGVGKVGKLRRI
jgi:hypothetical protein